MFAEPHAVAVRRPGTRAMLASVAVFAIALAAYSANGGFLYTYDSAPTSLAAYNLIANHSLFFDTFRNGYLQSLGAGYIFADVRGHLVSIFPIGTSILTAPIFLAEAAFHGGLHGLPDIATFAFESTRLQDEKHAAAIVAALAAALFFACAASIGSIARAAFVTIAFAFGTEMWTIGSQALWQHGSIELVTLAGTFALLHLERTSPHARRLAAIVGLCAGFLPVIRPTAALFSIGLVVAAVVLARRETPALLAGLAVGIAPGIAWNFVAFGSLVGGYGVDEAGYAFTPGQFLAGLAGLTISPSKGLLIYTPFVVVAAFAYVRALRGPHRIVFASLAVAALATLANYAFFTRWLGGTAYGPRYLTDLSVAVALPLVYAIPSRTERGRRPIAIVLAGLVAYAVCVQFVGIVGEPKSNWSGIPVDDGLYADRVWRVRDSQIERDARTALRLVRANPTAGSAYANGFSGAVSRVGARTIVAARGALVSVRLSVANDGTSTWYGYTTGLYFGQARVRVRIVDASGRTFGERYLYIAGTVPPGRSADAIGDFIAPNVPGRYRLRSNVDCYQNPIVNAKTNAETFDVTLDVVDTT